MRNIIRDGEPEQWKNFRKKYPDIQYKDLGKTEDGIAARQMLREHLVRSQFYLCAYCCRSIEETGDKSLNEHIKPQGRAEFSGYSMDYENIVASCNVKEKQLTCSSRKGNNYEEKLFVSPLTENCECHFRFYPNGEIEGTTEEGNYTCDLLGLNSYALQRARRATYKICEAYQDRDMVRQLYLIPQDGRLGQFADMIRYFYDRGCFAPLS